VEAFLKAKAREDFLDAAALECKTPFCTALSILLDVKEIKLLTVS
jgi:hypothetical protein